MQDLTHWRDRWETEQTGWHLHEPHPFLVEYARTEWNRVLVPLCGASRDLSWLVDSGREVWGVEISEVAARRIFAERSETPTEHRHGALTTLAHGNLTVAVGDFFALESELSGAFDAVWDRAALVAVPPELRAQYAATVRGVASGADLLLTVFDSEQGSTKGPPFSVPESEVRALHDDVELLFEDDMSERFADRGPGRFLRRLYRARIR